MAAQQGRSGRCARVVGHGSRRAAIAALLTMRVCVCRASVSAIVNRVLLRQLLAEEGEHLAPAIHCLLGPVEWPVPIKNAVAGAVVAVELVHLAVLLELGLVLVHLLGARLAVV